MAWQGIVKVHRNGTATSAYVYDQHRQHSYFIADDKKLDRLFPDGGAKAFWLVRWNGSSAPDFLSIADAQDW